MFVILRKLRQHQLFYDKYMSAKGTLQLRKRPVLLMILKQASPHSLCPLAILEV